MNDTAIPAWQVPAWAGIPGLRHRFYGRQGGCSTGDFSSLNTSTRVGDRAEAVAENRRRVWEDLSPVRVVIPEQVHGNSVLLAREPSVESVGEADGVVAAVPGLGVGILTADCVPILIIAPKARIAAAVHAGWKGTAMQIAQRAVEQLANLGVSAADLQVGLGPSIGLCCFEIGEEVASALEGAGRLPAAILDRSRARPHADLRAINAAQFESAGVPRERIYAVGPCTRCAPTECFSHRASNGSTGRQLSAVGFECL